MDQIIPGPCDPVLGCPPPTEIVCINVTKVYDSCFQLDTLSATTLVTPPVTGVVAATSCTVTSTSCSLVSSTASASPPNPLPPATPVFFNLTFSIQVTGTLSVTNAAGVTSSGNFVVTNLKTVTLFAPEGVSTNCSLTADCNITSVSGNSVIVTVDVCEVFQTTFEAQLLVPSYGFCQPSECTTLPIVCPPVPPSQIIPFIT